MPNIISPEKLTLIKKLAEENAAAYEVTPAIGAQGVLIAFKDGETINQLALMHRNYNPSMGRIFPLYMEEMDASQTIGGMYEDSALTDVVYYWGQIQNLDQPFGDWAANLSELRNAISDLSSHHYDYDIETGNIN
jgi:hypothetical protein